MRHAVNIKTQLQTRRLRAAAAAAALLALPLSAAAINNRSANAASASISGVVWADDDHSGTQNGVEAGVSGVTVTAYIPNGSGGESVAGSDTTDGNGAYTITTVQDDVSVRVAFSGAAVNPVALAKRNQFFGPSAAHSASLGVIDLATWNVSCGGCVPVTIGDRVWLDTDGDGNQEAGEAGISGVTMELRRDGAPISPAALAVTDSEGYYTFANYFSSGPSIVQVASMGANQTGYTVVATGVSTGSLKGFSRTITGGSSVYLDSDGVSCASGSPAGTFCDPESAAIATTASNGAYFNADIDFGFQPYDLENTQTITPTTVSVGDPVTITVYVSNNGPGAVAGCTLTNLLPTGLSYATVQPTLPSGFTNRNISAQTLTVDCTGEMANGATVNFDIAAIAQAGAGSEKNVAYVAPPSTDVPAAERIPLGSPVPTNATNTTTSTTNNDSESTVTVTPVVTTTTTTAPTTTTTTAPTTTTTAPTTTTTAPTTTTTAPTTTTTATTTTTTATTTTTTATTTTTTAATTTTTTAATTTTTPATTTTTPATTTTAATTTTTPATTTTTPATTTTAATTTTTPATTTTTPATTTTTPVVLASVGDFVWFDTDRNGLQNNGEAGVPGVTVRLLDPLGAIVQTQLTSSTGSYLFDGLNPGTYAIEFVLTGGGSGGSYAFTTARTGSDVSIDSDADQSTGRSLQFTLMAGDALRTIDAGVVTNTAPTTTIVTLNPTTTTPTTTIPTVTTTPVTTVPGTSTTVPAPTTTLGISVLGNCRIASTIWRDTNGNGVLDGTEVPFSGVTVQAAQGGLVFTATTNERGEYTINNLPCGEWTVTIIGGLPEGVPTPPAKTVRVLGEQVTNDVAPFGIALQSDPALTGGNTLRSLSFALSILGIGGLMATARRRRTSRGRV